MRFTVASSGAGARSRYRPYAGSSRRSDMRSTKSSTWMRSARPAPNSSYSMAAMAALARPVSRGMTQACGSAALRW